MSGTPHSPRRHAWLRVLVLLLALLVPGAQAQVHAAPLVAGQSAEYDVLDTAALRPPARTAHHPAAPARPAPLAAPPHGSGRDHSLPAPPWRSYPLLTLRTVVLRC
jgi:hypothetical protein